MRCRDLVLGPGERRKGDPAGRHSRLRVEREPAGDAARRRARVGRHPERRGGQREDGGDQSQPAADLLRLERRDDERRPGVLPRSRGRRSSSSTRRSRATSITSTPSIAIRPTITARSWSSHEGARDCSLDSRLRELCSAFRRRRERTAWMNTFRPRVSPSNGITSIWKST